MMKPFNKFKKRPQKEEKYLVNYNIFAKEVKCIDPDGNCKNLRKEDAISLAKSFELDLVQISSKDDSFPTCKILDYSKFKYEQSKKEKAAKKKQRENAIKIKEIKFRPSTDLNDLKTKAKQAQEFLNDGDKIKVTLVFKGRELSYQQIGYETMNTFFSLLTGAVYESKPVVAGKFMTSIIVNSKTEAA